MDVRAALKRQYHAALKTLKNAVDKCPDEMWTAADHPSGFWQVAYHTLFFTQLYLVQNEGAFRPWEGCRKEYECLEDLPWPPHRPPKLGEPYTKGDVLTYWRFCDDMVDATIDALDLDTDDAGFWWYNMPKLDHEIMNIRHIQQHAAQLEERLRATGLGAPDWVGGNTGEISGPPKG